MWVFNDFNTSVERALSEIDPKWRNYNGVIICGTHSPQNVETLLEEIATCRLNGIPFLGICFGHQLAAIEYARNVLGIADAVSEEIVPKFPGLTDNYSYIVRKRPEGLKVGLHDGENYWNNYEVDPEFQPKWQVEPWMFTAQFHPEYGSSKFNPHPLLFNFLTYARGK